ncbi:muscle M-line assembly protein unc-89 Uncoordinated protein 89 [Paenibacillus albidus]|uniref:muscle M-line assembly protein unc-89 Uncoordinated protein 89 n=1 Tax=Paenibacillus albidus TaxID=2041023 RepID=UPI001BE7D1FB|nr:muscle M-line assembly protein unc-89 Uncoordinated protein 89 [Paenibacillus albidus]
MNISLMPRQWTPQTSGSLTQLQSESRSQGKKGMQNNEIQKLQEHQLKLKEHRSNYLTQAMEKNTSPEVIQAELEQIDMQIQDIEETIQKQLMADKQKSLGMDEERKEDVQKAIAEKKERYEKEANPVHPGVASTYTMNAVLSGNIQMKQSSSIKLAQLTLHSEAKSWEHSDVEKSMKLKAKAEGLNGKLMGAAKEINEHLRAGLEKDVNNEESKTNIPPSSQGTIHEDKQQELQAYEDVKKGNKETTGVLLDTIA